MKQFLCMGNQILFTHILIEERISTLLMLVQKSVHDFQSQMKKYAADITECIK